MTVFMFVRHGQATHNLTHAYWDPRERDAALTTEGVRQVWALRSRNLGERCCAVWCSPLRRCRQTLAGVLGDFGLMRARVFLDDRLMEPQGEAIVNRRAEWEALRSDVPMSWDLDRVSRLNPFDLWVEGGSVGPDGHDGFERRIRAWTEEVAGRWPDGRVLVVTHHDWIVSWYRIYKRQIVSPGNAEVLVASI